MVTLATRQPAESVVSRALWARECPPTEAGPCGSGPEAPDRLVAAGGPWRGPAGRRRGRLVPEGDRAMRETPFREHGDSDGMRWHSTTEAAAMRPETVLVMGR